jgi:hypothetical protein
MKTETTPLHRLVQHFCREHTAEWRAREVIRQAIQEIHHAAHEAGLCLEANDGLPDRLEQASAAITEMEEAIARLWPLPASAVKEEVRVMPQGYIIELAAGGPWLKNDLTWTPHWDERGVWHERADAEQAMARSLLQNGKASAVAPPPSAAKEEMNL